MQLQKSAKEVRYVIRSDGLLVTIPTIASFCPNPRARNNGRLAPGPRIQLLDEVRARDQTRMHPGDVEFGLDERNPNSRANHGRMVPEEFGIELPLHGRQ